MSGDLAVELRRHEQQGSTGVLLAGDGEFHLAYGAVASAHCHRATGLDRLVVEAGVATPEDWRRAGAGDPSRVLEQPQLETLALLSVYDAAYFLLSSGAEAEFRPAPAHWLSRVCHVRPRELVRECERRGDPGSGPWPAELVDRAPVVPVRRVQRRRVVLTAGQVEVLAAADTRRTVTEIARHLGRTTYGCLTAVRELTEAGLVEPAVPEADQGDRERTPRAMPVPSGPPRPVASPRGQGRGGHARNVPSLRGPVVPESVVARVTTVDAPMPPEQDAGGVRTADAPVPRPPEQATGGKTAAAPVPRSRQQSAARGTTVDAPVPPEPGAARTTAVDAPVPAVVERQSAAVTTVDAPVPQPPRPRQIVPPSGRSASARPVVGPAVAPVVAPEEVAGERDSRLRGPEGAERVPVPFRRRIRRAVPVAERERWQQVDMSVLVRVRAALEELE